MRQISFALTTDQVRRRKKTVTRRLGWQLLPAGTLLQGVVKSQGLKKGERVEKLAVIRVETVRRERLDLMHDETGYGLREAALEGFAELTGKQFVAMFCEHNHCTPGAVVTRIEFSYQEEASDEGRP